VKRFAVILLILAACQSAPANTSPTPSGSVADNRPGAESPRRAVEIFLDAARAQDLQAMSLIWGTTKGPARRVVARDQLEKRELIMQCYFSHDKFEVLNDIRTKEGQHSLDVVLHKGSLARQTTFTTVLGPSDRWYVMDGQLEPVRDLCATK
jgi:hypothetical protein